MKMLHDHALGIAPNVYLMLRSALAGIPPIFNITGDSVVGNGSGYAQDAIYSSYGEYIERYHFYYEVDSTLKSALEDINNVALNHKIKKVLTQTKKTEREIHTHLFNLTHVRNIFNSEIAWLPTIMISLGDYQSLDRVFIPFTDSCGQACHISHEQALDSALNEFIERQALVGSWLSGRCRYAVNIEQHKKLGKFNAIIEQLKTHGSLYAFEINNNLPGYTLILFYFSNSENDIVRYSVGLATDADPVKAIMRAINELWQSYTFIYLNADNPENLDARYKYLNELIEFNTHQTKAIIPYFKTTNFVISSDDLLAFKKFNMHEMLQGLETLSTNIFSYERSQQIMGRRFHFCKILSPDFFLHMGINMPLNLDNPYSNLLGIDPAMQIKTAIPFP